MQTASRDASDGTDAVDTIERADRVPRDASIVAVVPAYNEADSVADVVRVARSYVDEVIVVDDASDDDTASVARDVADGVIAHPTNLGVGAALDTGYRYALREEYDLVVQFDADGQHDPDRIPDLLRAKEETGADVIVGSRWLNESHEDYSLVRRIGNDVFTFEANLLCGLSVTDVTSGFRLYDARVLDDLDRSTRNHWALEQTLEVAQRGYEIEEVSVPMPPNDDGSQFDLVTYALYPARMLVATLGVFLSRG